MVLIVINKMNQLNFNSTKIVLLMVFLIKSPFSVIYVVVSVFSVIFGGGCSVNGVGEVVEG